HLTGDAEFAARFRREAQAVAALEHPNIVRVYDFDTADDLAFLVMECITGSGFKEQLRELHNRGERLPLARVAQIMRDLADALDYAHQHGIIHRDLKPANVILATNDRAVLTDFGIARMIDATAITGSHDTLGTPAYMSPEQGRGEPGDARSDVYALGVMLYQLCTGKLPFDADTPYAIVLKHITAPLPSPRSVRPDLPDAVERVILKSLAKNAADRFQTAGDLARALQLALESPAPRPIALPRLPRAPRPAWRPLALVFATILLCFILFIASRPLRVERFLAQATLAPTAERTAITFNGPGVVEDTWLDPDASDEAWHASETAHLHGARKPDRILIGFNLTRLPVNALPISATLTLRIERATPDATPCKITAYRLLVPWRPATATYNSPWSKPGMAANKDYDPTPLDLVALSDSGTRALDVTPLVASWLSRGRAGGGLVLMLADDSDPNCHYSIATTERANPADRPTLRVVYEVPK
ncbi:MAG: serine/threonine protein kinase, partial [Chloroflexi bacterium]|nr:serine/threonine protein kinase [Chloroflexota bacterium]